MNKLEQVVKAIVRSDVLVTEHGRKHIDENWPKGWEDERDDALPQARAAIAAMREPTEEMLDALTVRHRREVQRHEIGKDYTAMIDAALSTE